MASAAPGSVCVLEYIPGDLFIHALQEIPVLFKLGVAPWLA